MRAKAFAKFVEPRGRQCHSGSLAVAAEFGEQIGHGFEPFQEMKRSNAAAGALCEAVFDPQHERGTMIPFDHAARDDSDYAAMPAFGGEYQRGVMIGHGLLDALLENRARDFL